MMIIQHIALPVELVRILVVDAITRKKKEVKYSIPISRYSWKGIQGTL